MAFGTFTRLCNQRHSIIAEHSHPPQTDSPSPSAVSPHSFPNDGHLGGSYLSGIAIKATMTSGGGAGVGKHLFEFLLPVFLDIYLGVELLGHMVTLCLTSQETAKLFSNVAAPIYIPTSNTCGFQYLHILASTYFPFILL